MSTPPVPPGRPDPDDLEPDPTGIRALLGALPDPGPMPDDLVERITASIAAERSTLEDHAVVPLRPSRRWGWRQVAAVAAAVAVVGVGVPALLSGPGGVVASLSGGSAADSESAASGSDSASEFQAPASPNPVSPSYGLGGRASAASGAVTMAASGTAYASSSLVTQAERAQGSSSSVQDHASKDAGAAAESDAGLRACLTAVGVEAWMPVWGDVASLDGRPAVVAVVTGDTGRVVYAVSSACDARHPDVLAGPLLLP